MITLKGAEVSGKLKEQVGVFKRYGWIRPDGSHCPGRAEAG